MRVLRLAAVLQFLLCSPAFASECDQPHKDRAVSLSSIVAQKLVPERFLGGKNISSSVVSCQYDASTDVFTIGLRVTWNGVLMTWNVYEIWGEATTNSAGDRQSFVLAGGNDKAQELVFWGDITGKVMELSMQATK